MASAILALGAFGYPGPLEMGLILVALLLLFGAKRIPEIARSLGTGIQEFKKSVTAIEDDNDSGASRIQEDDQNGQ